MKLINLMTLMVVIIAMGACEKQDPSTQTTQDAKIVGFVPEKCYCCWGWVIEIDKTTIKSEDIPGLDLPSDLEAINNLKTSPISGKIKIGKKETDCENKPDYYEILQFDQNK
jgi:hypothetical protein